MSRLTANSQRGDEGVALILALLFVVLMAAVVVDLAYEMQVEAMFVDQQDAEFEAYVAAKSAVAGGMGLLAADYYGTGDLFTDTINEPRTQNQNQTAQHNQNQEPGQNPGQNQQQNQGQLYDSLDDAWAQGVAATPVNDATMQCTIQDEFGKINLNRLLIITSNGQLEVYTPIEDRLRMLLEYRELEEKTVDTIVDSLIDWMDSGDDGAHEPNGSETDYYQTLDPPYAAKDGPMDSIEELLLIPGVTPEVYYGNPDKEQLPLPDLLTVHGHPEGKINVNTAPIPVLEAHFAARREFDPQAQAEDLAMQIHDRGPYQNVDELRQDGLLDENDPRGRNNNTNNGNSNNRPAPKQDRADQSNTDQNQNGNQNGQGDNAVNEPDMLDVVSSVFRLRGDGWKDDAMVRIEAYVWRSAAETGVAPELFRMVDWRVIE